MRLSEENQLNAFLSDGNFQVAYLAMDFAQPKKEFRFTQKTQAQRPITNVKQQTDKQGSIGHAVTTSLSQW